MSTELPLLAGPGLDAPIAWQRGRWISRGALLAHAEALAARLPRKAHALNMCDDRYHFMVALAALLLRESTALLPPSAAPRAVAELARAWDAAIVDDALVAAAAPTGGSATAIPTVSAERAAVILFTSGSTGVPAAQAKTWAELTGATRLALRRFGLEAVRHDIVATVPAQHSYGFESSVLYAMLGPAVVHMGRPLYPADVRTALAAVEAPRLFVTTPVHLSACVRAGLSWPLTTQIICATAPLGHSLAQAAEETFGAPLHEIYGCSEAGAIASRHTRTETAWLPYDGVALEQIGDDLYVQGPHLPDARILADVVSVAEDGRFELIGRKADQIKVAGKRVTLAELNRRLLEIDGVEDGTFVVPDEERRARLAAVVVAPDLDEAQIRGHLAEVLDPVFLPRPLVRVAVLARTAAGKLRREYLLGLIREGAGRSDIAP